MTYFMIFHGFLEILILFTICWIYFCEKAPAATNRWHLFMIVHDFLEILIFFMIYLNILFAKRRLRQRIYDICSWFSWCSRNSHIVHVFLNIMFAKRRLRQIIDDIFHIFHDFLEIIIFSMICRTFCLRKGACGKEYMTFVHACSWFSRNSHIFHDFPTFCLRKGACGKE